MHYSRETHKPVAARGHTSGRPTTMLRPRLRLDRCASSRSTRDKVIARLRGAAMVPQWMVQLAWFASGIFATGAFWYFLSQRAYHVALWTGFAAIVLALAAVALHLHNDLKLRQDSSSEPRSGTGIAQPSVAPPQATVAAVERTALPDREKAEIALSDDRYSPMTMEEYFDAWYNKSTTSLQRDELEARMLNRLVIWTGVLRSLQLDSDGTIRATVQPIDGSYGTAFLNFGESQRSDLVSLHKDQQIQFTGRISSFIASPFLADCKLLKVLRQE